MLIENYQAWKYFIQEGVETLPKRKMAAALQRQVVLISNIQPSPT